MIFELHKLKYTAMKKLFIIISTLMVISSCASNKEANSSRIELRNERKLAEQAIVKKAVESKRFIIKLEKLYFIRGGMVDLVPRSNYIIIDGTKAIISAAYFGRQYDIRPIAGINMQGETTDYEVTSDFSKGIYEITTKISNRGNSFDVYLSIGKDGLCNVSLSSIRIDGIRYRGHIVPIRDKPNTQPQKSNII